MPSAVIYPDHPDLAPPTIDSMVTTAVGAALIGGRSNSLTVVCRFSGPIQDGGTTVTLASSNTAICTVPASAAAAAGVRSVSFVVSAVNTAAGTVVTRTAVTITATLNGVATKMFVYITPPVISSITGGVSSVFQASTVTYTVNILGRAPTGGQVINLSYDAPPGCVVTGPATVTVNAGSTSRTFSVTFPAVRQVATEVIVLRATINGVDFATKNVSLTYAGFPISMTVTNVVGGADSSTRVNIAAPVAFDHDLILTGDPDYIETPVAVTIPANQPVGTTFLLKTKPVASSVVTTVSVRDPLAPSSTVRTASLTLLAPAVSSVVVNGPVQCESNTTGTVTLTAPAPPEGLTVALSSNKTWLAQVDPTMFIKGGETSATFIVRTLFLSSSTTAAITATPIAGVPVTSANFNVRPIAPKSLSPSLATVKGGQTVPIRVYCTNINRAAFDILAQLFVSGPGAAYASVPVSQPIPSGASFFDFSVVTTTPPAPTNVTVSVLFGTVNVSAQVNIAP